MKKKKIVAVGLVSTKIIETIVLQKKKTSDFDWKMIFTLLGLLI